MLQKLSRWLQGRHTMFAIYFALVGTVLAWYHRLDINFIMLIGAVQSFVLGHSIKEDWFAMKAAAAQQATPDTQPVTTGVSDDSATK
jgi:hypothetical protein